MAKLTKDQLRILIKEEIKHMLQENDLSHIFKTVGQSMPFDAGSASENEKALYTLARQAFRRSLELLQEHNDRLKLIETELSGEQRRIQ